jgi:hypothetical protein
MSDDINGPDLLKRRKQECLDAINGTDPLKRQKGIDRLGELLNAPVRRRAAGKLHGKLEPFLINKEETGDLQQGVWVLLLEEIEAGRCPKTVDQLDGLIGCLLRNEAVVRNRVHNGKKGSKRPQFEQANDSGPAPVELVADKDTGPATAAERDGFWELVDELPEPERSVYKHHCQRKTYAEIGASVGLTVPMVKDNLRKARLWLGKKLQ